MFLQHGKDRFHELLQVRCGGRTSQLAARKKKEKPKPKFRSYTEARKDREKFRKRLVELIMHRDEWDNEVRPATCICFYTSTLHTDALYPRRTRNPPTPELPLPPRRRICSDTITIYTMA